MNPCRVISVLIFLAINVLGRDVIKLEAVNFELALTSYPYVAILFYDESPKSKTLLKNWEEAALQLNDSDLDGELAKVSC